ncbi:MAG: hypothetical protein LPK19_09980 [Hymenobacteraceae bacterium]|nr:hypothetical protein [Hymenobacteraceae bacterium]MDX5396551.1 hypothetical protein [Hymenobacteraceae bacterium]MDX5512615.1 hypothetical protein [Hymenobacteraceae bacterium]
MIKQASVNLNKIFDTKAFPARKTLTYEQVVEKLAAVIEYLLQNEHKRLLHIIYRIDIDERKFTAALNLPTLALVAERVAELVIERELQKVQFRLKYSSN